MKTCTKCGEIKPLNQFYKSSKNKDGLASSCKACDAAYSRAYYERNRDLIIKKTSIWAKKNPDKKKQIAKKSHLNKKYSITIEEEAELKNKQNNLCAICNETLGYGHRTHVDHCHNTGKIRGLLCNKCNRGLGFFNDSQKNLKNAIEYLKQHQ